MLKVRISTVRIDYKSHKAPTVIVSQYYQRDRVILVSRYQQSVQKPYDY